MLFSLVCPGTSGEERDGERHDLPAGIAQAYGKLAESMKSEDLRGFMSVFSLDFVFEGRDRSTTDRGPWRRVWVANFEAGDYERVAFEPERVLEKEGDRVIVRTRRVVVFRPAGTGERQVREAGYEDIWVLNAEGVWQLVYHREREVRTEGTLSAEEDPIPSPRLAAFAREKDRSGEGNLEAFWKELDGSAPLIEPIPGDAKHRWVTFVWRERGRETAVGMRGGLPAPEVPKPLRPLGETGLWYRTERIPGNARFSYDFMVREALSVRFDEGKAPQTIRVASTRTDPLNPNVVNGRSVVVMPGAPKQSWIVPVSGRPSGDVERHRIDSAVLGEERVVDVYTPPGYSSLEVPCRVLFLFDGEDYRRRIPTPVILDNLLAEEEIRPTVAVLVLNQGTRLRDLAFSPRFVGFLSGELVPWVRERFRVRRSPEDIIVGGTGLGGAMAAWTALREPGVFGNVLSQSGEFRRAGGADGGGGVVGEEGGVIREFVRSAKLPLRFYLEVGTLEAESMVSHSRRLRDVLEAKGYPVTYIELPGGHDFLTRRNSLARGLRSLARP